MRFIRHNSLSAKDVGKIRIVRKFLILPRTFPIDGEMMETRMLCYADITEQVCQQLISEVEGRVIYFWREIGFAKEPISQPPCAER